MATLTNRTPGLSVAEAPAVFTPEGRDIRIDERSESRAAAQPHEDVVEFLLEQYRDVMIRLADR